MAGADVKLLTSWASPYGLRVEFALAAKGVPYLRLLEEDVVRNKSQLLLQSNPIHKKVPVLLHNGKPLSESIIIIDYIDSVWPSPHGKDLLPADPYDRAMAHFWSDYVDKKVYGAVKTGLMRKGEVQKAAFEELRSTITTLEGLLKEIHEGPFFGGDHVGLVDVVLGPMSLSFPACEIVGNFEFRFEELFPRFHTWFEAMKTSPCAHSFPDLEKFKEHALNLHKRFATD